MAGSRLERVGTIFSRMTGLIRAGAVSYEDRPLWFDVYKSIPPKDPPKYERVISDEPVRDIFYPEDVIRAKFYNCKDKVLLPQTDLTDNTKLSTTQKLIDLCEKFQKEKNMHLDEAFDNAIAVLKSEGIIRDRRRKSGDPTPESVMASYREALEKRQSEIQPINIKDILKDDEK